MVDKAAIESFKSDGFRLDENDDGLSLSLSHVKFVRINVTLMWNESSLKCTTT